jgi:DUF4097 and DUF4098 domain-containing protein YvlB
MLRPPMNANRKLFALVWVPPLLAAAACAQMRQEITREGPYVVQTTTGTMPIAPNARLKVDATGSITIRGSARQGCAYTVKQRVRARSEAAAKRLLRDIIVRNLMIRDLAHGDLDTLSVLGADPGAVICNLNLSVPRGLREVVMMSHGGDVGAYDLDGSVHAETAGGQVQMDRIGSNAVARTGGSEIRIGYVRGSLHCISAGGNIQVTHAGGETWCDTAGGEITIHEVDGPLHATTAGGNIQVYQAASYVTARSDGGLIDVQRSGGLVSAQTREGWIQIGSARGAQCESAAGTIRVKSSGGALRAQTALGNILASLLPGPHIGDSSLTTTDGDITVYISSKIAVSIQAVNATLGNLGRIISDFPEIRVNRGGPEQPVMAEGSLNGGGPLLRISAAGGNIYLRRER